uniref:ubiquitinyl hydrolase 1 n=1 Tax=Mucochytrium quahogii TaxID=96639 RepID=A0A7S2RCV6_9STRA|mmetsp:Transcript_9419/g.15381  ORF Transcript_9419/g.15381 Transcript_9419/m.15381 type:complete len:418 (+) Transcript_9419:378-1631(+)|eukprot:CAMPEP_0203748522 /NCGR_PEP_ID=MMETSP0098-20131031/3381_1 /ASSEMBLY_ACC=CAM_ASM_000208 /TAXON_ID=96639 /ORGANISM=" , Strain NY0313808BC1" /LENGTH=417 /DNA_ID=CAMNT_0050637297 /DNA_START=461 /DNA_END=1714 /DNA_ORIENTATION=-
MRVIIQHGNKAENGIQETSRVNADEDNDGEEVDVSAAQHVDDDVREPQRSVTMAVSCGESAPKTVQSSESQVQRGSYSDFLDRLKKQKGLEVLKMKGDGNCLFRSISAQVLGEPEWHAEIRKRVTDYMWKEKSHFSSFVAGGFDQYVAKMRAPGVFGSSPEIQAAAELYNRSVEVYSFSSLSNDSSCSCSSNADAIPHGDSQKHEIQVKPINIFQGTYKSGNVPLRLLYSDGKHYDAVVDPYEASIGVGLGLPSFEPGKVEKDILDAARKKSMGEFTKKKGFFYADHAATEAELMDVVKRKSIHEFWKTQIERDKTKTEDGILNQDETPRKKRKVEALEYPQSVQELVVNGFDLAVVLEAYAVAGDSFDAMLSLLAARSTDAFTSSSSSSSSSCPQEQATDNVVIGASSSSSSSSSS